MGRRLSCRADLGRFSHTEDDTQADTVGFCYFSCDDRIRLVMMQATL
jgi:hypothetical protein